MKGVLLYSEQYGPCVVWTCATLADEFDDFLTDGPWLLYNIRSDDRTSAVIDEAKVEFFFGTLADAVKVRRLVEHFLVRARSTRALGNVELEIHEPYPG